MIKFLRILFLTVLASPAFAQASFDVETYDLGPEIFGSPTHGAYGIRGRIYPAGTYTPAPGQPAPRDACTPAEGVPWVGNYYFRIAAGDQAENVGEYVWNLGRWPVITQVITSGWWYSGPDEAGLPIVNFYPASILNRPEKVLFIEYTPRSTACFGGQLKIFIQKETQ